MVPKVCSPPMERWLNALLKYHFLGWGVFLSQFLSTPVVNDAVGGESARSFSDQGLFDSLISSTQAGDYVIIEFGHNDVSAGAVDNGKQDAVGDGYNITSTVTTATLGHFSLISVT